MRDTASPPDRYDELHLYEIRMEGHLDDRWAERFGGLSFTHEGDGTTILRGPVADQAALHGVLRKVRDLAMPLISVIRVGRVLSAPTGQAQQLSLETGPADGPRDEAHRRGCPSSSESHEYCSVLVTDN